MRETWRQRLQRLRALVKADDLPEAMKRAVEEGDTAAFVGQPYFIEGGIEYRAGRPERESE